MQQNSPFLVIVFLFSVLLSDAQENKILFQPEKGKEYNYEFTEFTYHINEVNEKVNQLLKKKTLNIRFDKYLPENRELLMVNVIKNTIEKPGKSTVHMKDYRFPDFKDGYYEQRYTDYYERLFSRVSFKYEYDFKTANIKLLNREELLIEVKTILEEIGFNKKNSDNQITKFNTEGIPQITGYLQSIYQISDVQLFEKNWEKDIYDISLNKKDSITLFHKKRWIENIGLYSLDFEANLDKRFLKKYNTLQTDTFKINEWPRSGNYKYIEKSIQLKSFREIPTNMITISGDIEKLKNRKITVAVLRDPYGIQLNQESVILDANNSFKIETELNHPGLVYLQFGSNNRVNELPGLLLYAEPGSNIHIKTTGETVFENIDITGDFAYASEMINNFLQEHVAYNGKINFNTLNWNPYNLKYPELISAFSNIESFTDKYKNRIEEPVFEFVRHELKAQMMVGVLFYLNMKNWLDKSYIQAQFPEQKKINTEQLEDILNTINIYEIYNEYGIFSRQLARDYLSYFLYKNRKVFNLDFPDYMTTPITFFDNAFIRDFPQLIEVAKTQLTGHVLYGILADLLLDEKRNEFDRISQNDLYLQSEVDKYCKLMVQVCNDNEFLDAFEEGVGNQLKWMQKEYVPSTQFLDDKERPVKMSDFFGKKPTTFYITQDWSKERYFWDDLAKENPEINFVLVMEGSNLKEWTDYIKRADPKAFQLFLVNNKEQLRDIFKKVGSHFVTYDKEGVRVGYAENVIDAMNLAKHSLQNPFKNEVDKSTLQIIIFGLGFLLVVITLTLLIWRWRSKQRFRKELQFRRLCELELTAIRSQMNPHFLFNSLNSVQNLIQQNKGREAHLYLSDFAGLIRKVLRNSEKEEVSLSEELEMVEQYLNLEKLRFDFEFLIKVEESIDAQNTMVPSMLLQPFAENAVIHGLLNKSSDRKLSIEVTIVADGIKIVIEDNGIGREAARQIEAVKNGKGIKFNAERLNLLQDIFNEKYQLEIIDLELGTRVVIVFPEEK